MSPVKVKQNYSHVFNLMTSIVISRINDEESMNKPVVLEADDPRRLSKTIAGIYPKPTGELAQVKVSRLQK